MTGFWQSYSSLESDDLYAALTADSSLHEELVQLAKEYFAISVGIRKPTEQEKNEARRALLTGIFGDKQPGSIDRVRMAKYPPRFMVERFIEDLFRTEYVIYRVLAENTSIVGGPFLPMLRAEIHYSTVDFERDEFQLTLLRQSAFFETYCRMKLEREKTTEWRHLNLNDINILTAGNVLILKRFRNIRDDYAHDWRLFLNKSKDNEELRETCRKALYLISTLHKRELIWAYQKNCSASIGQRRSAEWPDRDVGVMKASARETVSIQCDSCGHKFDPVKERWKRCPSCGNLHDFLNQYE